MGILAIDFGGTRLRAGWFDDDLILRQRTDTHSRVEDGAEIVVQRIIETARRVIPAEADIRVIGIAAPGPLDAQRGVILHAKTLPGWGELPLTAIISREFGDVPTYMQNDANLAALAEYHRGAGIGCDPLIYMTISTGIGGGAIINGELFTGWRGLAIEPGHMRLTTPDGSIKRLEELASGTALGNIARERLQTYTSPTLLSFPVDGKAVGEAALQGDALALSIVQEAGHYLGIGLVNVLHMFNPQAIVLGGSVTNLGDLILNPAREMIQQHLLDSGFYEEDLIRIAQLKDDVCLVGAAFYSISALLHNKL